MNLPIIKKDKIETQRLALKPYASCDRDALVQLFKDERVSKTFMVPDYKTDSEFEFLADKLIEFSQIADTAHLEYGIYLNDKPIGFINDCGIEDDEIEIGYVISPDYWGKGYASEAVKAVIEELRIMGFKKVTAGYFEGNDGSRRVMEKCGMKSNGFSDTEEYRGKELKCYYYEINF